MPLVILPLIATMSVAIVMGGTFIGAVSMD